MVYMKMWYQSLFQFFSFRKSFPSPFLEENDIQCLTEHLGSRCPRTLLNVFPEKVDTYSDHVSMK